MSRRTSNPNIYQVEADENIEDFITDKAGYIWFDEVGLLGLAKVYNTQEEAENALKQYCKEFL